MALRVESTVTLDKGSAGVTEPNGP
jgi:hypothetical protein